MTLFRLALGNVRRASRDYLVYLITLTLGVTVFYAFNTIAEQTASAGLGAELGELLGEIISGVTVFLACVLGFLMVYANNFIMRRRKQQFGLYQILGMGRGQVALIMTLETAMVSAGALALGLASGIGLSQLMTFFTASLFRTQIANFHFFVSGGAAALTVVCLAAIFLVTLVFNLRVVAKARVIDLMGARRTNEQVATRNPLVSAVLFVAGAALVGVAYARLLHDGLPVMMDSADEMSRFWLTTGTVVAGTVLLFFGLSGFLLKLLQGLRGLWWRGLNMFTLRQLAAKVNTVSMSMAVISLILFLALTSVTTGMSINSVMNEGVERGTPADFSAAVAYYSPHNMAQVRERIRRGYGDGASAELARIASVTEPVDAMAAYSGAARATAAGEDAGSLDLFSIAGAHMQVDTYDSMPAEGAEPYVSLVGLAQAAGVELPQVWRASTAADTALELMRESDYNRYLAFRGLAPVSLGTDGYVITSDAGASTSRIYDAALAKGVVIGLGGRELKPAAAKVDPDASTFLDNAVGSNSGIVVVPDAALDGLGLAVTHSYLLVDYAPGKAEEADKTLNNSVISGTITDAAGNEVGYWNWDMTRTSVYESTNTTNGLISYLSIYIGFVLVVACGAILTIQQLSGVADAAPSYRLLAELGCDGGALRRSLLAQQAVFFAFPLAVGVAHSAVALHVIVGVVDALGALAIGGAVGLTCAIFVACYGGYFLLTYALGAGILRESVRSR